MAKDHTLLKRLEQASAGIVATSGDENNLYALARKELARLYAIEEDVKRLLEPVHGHDDSRGFHGTSPTLHEVAQKRLEAGRRMALAVGAIKPTGGAT